MIPKRIFVEETTSTNDDLAYQTTSSIKSLIAPTAFTCIRAAHQKSGRGRNGHVWVAASGTSLLTSILIEVPKSGEAALGWVPLIAGLATAEVIDEEFQREDEQSRAKEDNPKSSPAVGLKWPNDILIDGKKVGGILSELIDFAFGSHWVTAGIGVNLTQSTKELAAFNGTSLAAAGKLVSAPGFSPNDAEEASAVQLAHTANETTSLKEESAGDYANYLEQRIVRRLRSYLGEKGELLANPEHLAYVAKRYRARHLLTGKRIKVTVPGGTVLTGTATGINNEGALILCSKNRSLRTVTAGDVALIPDSPKAAPALVNKAQTSTSTKKDK